MKVDYNELMKLNQEFDPNNWSNEGHEWSEYYGTTANLWNIIYPKFKDYLKGDVLEIAPGFGRITEYLIKYNITLSLIDLNEICIAKCIEKFRSKIKNYIVGNGKSLNFNDESFDFIISYDSFVHMSEDVIENYIKDIYRTLKKGGYCFIHHSFLYGGSENPADNVAGRSNMTPEIFKGLVSKYNMNVISQEDFKISENINDTITIFQKM